MGCQMGQVIFKASPTYPIYSISLIFTASPIYEATPPPFPHIYTMPHPLHFLIFTGPCPHY